VEEVERDEGKPVAGIGRGDEARRAEDVGRGEEMVEWRAMVLQFFTIAYTLKLQITHSY